MTTEIDGVAAIDLRSEAGALEASVVPGAGMVVCSLRHHGDELLGQRARPARVRRGAGDDGHPAALPVGQPGRVGQLRGRRSQGRPGPGLAAAAARFGGPGDARPALGRPRMAGRRTRRHRRARQLRLRCPEGPDRGVSVPAPRRLRGLAAGLDAVDHNHRRGDGGYGGARGLWLSPLFPPPRHRPRRLGARGPGSGAAAAGPTDAADGRTRAGRGHNGSAGLHAPSTMPTPLPRRRDRSRFRTRVGASR